MKNIIVLLTFILVSFSLLLTGCDSSLTEDTKTKVPESPETTLITDMTPSVEPTPSVSETPDPSTTPTLTPDLTPSVSETPSDPRYEEAYGPIVYGEMEYKVYIKNGNVVFFMEDESIFLELNGVTIEDDKLFLISSSFIDANFDGVADLSYLNTDGRRTFYLGTQTEKGITFSYHEELSALYGISKCEDTRELYARLAKDSKEYYSFTFSKPSGELVRSQEPISNAFEWNIQSLSQAIAGLDATLEEGGSIILRENECKSYLIGGHITVAMDSYGNYYIKDMPHKGFYRISLNPNGRWNKSEQVSEDTL